MAKKASFKLLWYDKRKLNNFHDLEVYPLYCRIVYNSKPNYYKSFFFELFQNRCYEWFFRWKTDHRNADFVFATIEPLEKALFNHVVSSLGDQMSHETFIESYREQSYDVLYNVNEALRLSMVPIFEELDMPSFRDLLFENPGRVWVFQIIRDLQKKFDAESRKEFEESLGRLSSRLNKSYLPFYNFLQTSLNGKPPVCLPANEWLQPRFKDAWKNYCKDNGLNFNSIVSLAKK